MLTSFFEGGSSRTKGKKGKKGKKKSPVKIWGRPLWTAPIQKSNSAYHTPPKCIGQTLKIFVYIFFHQVYDK